MKERGNQIMPDGRPLFAWENEIAMLWIEKKKAEEIGRLLTIFNFSVKHWEDFKDRSLHIRVSANNMHMQDFEQDPEKYFEIIKEGDAK